MPRRAQEAMPPRDDAARYESALRVDMSADAATRRAPLPPMHADEETAMLPCDLRLRLRHMRMAAR